MKPIIFSIALIGFTAVGSYAQTEDFVLPQKIVRQQPINIVDVQPTTGKYEYFVPDTATADVLPQTADTALRFNTTTNPTPGSAWISNNPDGSKCYVYKQHNITVAQCPETFYKNADSNPYGSYQKESSYSGYYPVKTITTTTVKSKTSKSVHHTAYRAGCTSHQ